MRGVWAWGRLIDPWGDMFARGCALRVSLSVGGLCRLWARCLLSEGEWQALRDLRVSRVVDKMAQSNNERGAFEGVGVTVVGFIEKERQKHSDANSGRVENG